MVFSLKVCLLAAIGLAFTTIPVATIHEPLNKAPSNGFFLRNDIFRQSTRRKLSSKDDTKMELKRDTEREKKVAKLLVNNGHDGFWADRQKVKIPMSKNIYVWVTVKFMEQDDELFLTIRTDTDRGVGENSSECHNEPIEIICLESDSKTCDIKVKHDAEADTEGWCMEYFNQALDGRRESFLWDSKAKRVKMSIRAYLFKVPISQITVKMKPGRRSLLKWEVQPKRIFGHEESEKKFMNSKSSPDATSYDDFKQFYSS